MLDLWLLLFAIARLWPAQLQPVPEEVAVLAASPVAVRDAASATLATVCAVHLRLPAATMQDRVLCDLPLLTDTAVALPTNFRLRVTADGAAYVHLQGACPPGLRVAPGAHPRTLQAAALQMRDPGAVGQVCAAHTGFLGRPRRRVH